MTKDKWTFQPARTVEQVELAQHFYASSVAEWRVDKDPAKLIQAFKRERYAFCLWFVPVDIAAPYQINFYAPQVEGAKLLGTFKWGDS